MKNWDFLYGMYGPHRQEGGCDGIFVSSKELLDPSRCMSTTKELCRWAMERRKKMHRPQSW